MQYLTTPESPSRRLNRTLPAPVRRAQGLALLGARVLQWRVLPPEKVPACTSALRQLEGVLGVVSHLAPRGDLASRADRQALEALEIHARTWVVEGLQRARRIPGLHAFDLRDRLQAWAQSQAPWVGFPLEVAFLGGPLKVGGRPEAFDRLILAWMGRAVTRGGRTGPLRIVVCEGAFENGNPAAELLLDSPGCPWAPEMLSDPEEPGLPGNCPEARSLEDLLAELRGTGALVGPPGGGNRWAIRLPLAPQFHP